MKYPWLVKDQQNILKLLKYNAQAIILHGNIGMGKKNLAYTIADILLCQQQNYSFACGKCQSCHLRHSHTQDVFHPDFFSLKALDNKTTIGIDEIHKLNYSLQTTPYLGIKQIVIIYPIEQLTTPASNSLLKTLEEPSQNTIFILVSHNIKAVLPTITSRCLNYYIKPPTKEQSNEYINNLPNKFPQSLVNILANKPLLINHYDVENYNKIIKFLINPFLDFSLIDEKNLQQLHQLLDICVYWLYDLMYYKNSGKVLYFSEIYNIKNYLLSYKDIFICWEQLIELSKNKQFNLNNKLLFNVFIYYYQRIFKEKNE